MIEIGLIPELVMRRCVHEKISNAYISVRVKQSIYRDGLTNAAVPKNQTRNKLCPLLSKNALLAQSKKKQNSTRITLFFPLSLR